MQVPRCIEPDVISGAKKPGLAKLKEALLGAWARLLEHAWSHVRGRDERLEFDVCSMNCKSMHTAQQGYHAARTVEEVLQSKSLSL
jgi:hypothetical protein